MPTIITVFVDPHTRLHNWTYTKKQEEDGYDQLTRISLSYPIPSFLKSIQQGGEVRIESNIREEDLSEKLSNFVSSIRTTVKTPFDKRIFDEIGNIPLHEIHDPQLKEKVSTLWTLDVSYNPALSIKDIIAKQMIEDAFKEKKIISGKTFIVEATSGNTGAGLALLGLYYGLTTILVLPDKVSEEKISRLRKFGAHVVIAPTHVSPGNPRSYYSIRDALGKHKDAWVPQQYDNPSNSRAHRLYTGPHIWEKTKGKVTAVIIPTGTSGTISGIGQYLKKMNPKIKIIGVDTVGSILYLLKKGFKVEDVQRFAHSYDIQGFGEDFQPKNLDLNVIDAYIRVSDITGLQMTQLLLALGLFQGQSSGASYAALLESLEKNIITQDDNVVVIFPDVGIPYRHDVYNDEWMKLKKFSLDY